MFPVPSRQVVEDGEGVGDDAEDKPHNSQDFIDRHTRPPLEERRPRADSAGVPTILSQREVYVCNTFQGGLYDDASLLP